MTNNDDSYISGDGGNAVNDKQDKCINADLANVNQQA